MSLTDIIKNDKKEKKEISEKEAFEIIKEWGEALEVRLNDDDFESVQKEICKAVQKERLTFDESTEEFIYKFRKPIMKKDSDEAIHRIVKIRDCTLEQKRDISKAKNGTDQNIETFKAYLTTMDGEQIPIGHIGRIQTTDQNIISAVILGFFVQAVPGVE